MSPDRQAGTAAPSGPRPAGWPLLPGVLLALALVAALLASQAALAAWWAALALLLSAAGALISGALWGRQRERDRLQQARSDHQLLGQLVDVWCWQTDAQHRLLRLQPPSGAPASAWAQSSTTDPADNANAPVPLLWHRFIDPAQSLQARMQAHAPLGELPVQQANGPDGSQRPWRLRGLPRLDARGRFAGYLGTAWPTEHDDARRTAHQAFEALLQQGQAALCLGMPVADGKGWQVHRANPAARQLLGLPGNASGQPWAQALAGLPEALRDKVLALHEGDATEADGWRARLDAAGDGVLLSLVPQAGDNAPAAAALLAEQAAFSYTISHDLRAPIRVVEGFGRILKEDYGNALDRMGRDHLDRVMAAAARMNHMIDALLSVSRLSTQPLAQQPVNLSQLAQYVVDDLQRASPERVVQVHIAPGLSTQGDPTLLRMALENLLGNAWKYSAKVAQADVRFERLEQAGRPVYCVSDNGAGFDMRFADRLFGVFQRLHSHSDFQGHGVGLASVRRIIRRHGGEVWAEGEVGQGARFYFTLKG